MSGRVGGLRHNGHVVDVPFGKPRWNVTYNAQQSTIFMPCSTPSHKN